MSDASIAGPTADSRPRENGAPPLVHLRYQGHPIGLYGVRELEPHRLTVRHGAISLPVGTRVVVEDVLGLVPGARPRRLSAQVTENESWGMSLKL
jgi:hypothetical protein